MKKYKIGFDMGGLILFLAIMLPNLIWFNHPAPVDILRGASVTETLDAAASVLQVLTVAALIFLVRPDRKKLRLTPLLGGAIIWIALYYGGWVLYYQGQPTPPVILLLTVPPCLALLLYAADRKNFPALVPGIGFVCCHLVYAAVNFML